MTPKGAKFNGALTVRVKRMPHLPNPSPGPALESDHFGSNLSHYAVALGKSLFFLCFHYLICKMGMMVVSLLLMIQQYMKNVWHSAIESELKLCDNNYDYSVVTL